MSARTRGLGGLEQAKASMTSIGKRAKRMRRNKPSSQFDTARELSVGEVSLGVEGKGFKEGEAWADVTSLN
jgi:hypothetical protein